MRRPVKIEREASGVLYKHVLRRLDSLDVRGVVVRTPEFVALLVGDARRVVGAVLAQCREADAALGFGPEPAEQAAREYLAGVCERESVA